MNKVFKPKKEKLFGFMLLIYLFLLWFIDWLSFAYPAAPVMIVMTLILTGLIIWIWFETQYRIDDSHLFYKSGPLRGKIRISDIKEISRNVTSWVGMRPALAFRYLKIRYNRFNDLYIAPEDENGFIDELTQVNPEIVVMDKDETK